MKKTYHQFKRILIANRGEIAVRIIRTAREMGIETVAIYTSGEEIALHVQHADFKAFLKGTSLKETYLNAEQIIFLAQQFQAEAIHPGYGFLSENDHFAQLCIDNNIVFIGPSPLQIKQMGNKEQANNIAAACGIPLLKKVNGAYENMILEAKHLKMPLVIKASAGGGGKGMRVVKQYDELPDALKSASDEAERYFGNKDVYIEPYLENPRHIEVQILADHHGNTIHLYERECSIQRRHQKIIEEAPAPNLSPEIREKIVNDAITIAKNIEYTSAGTVEFLLDSNDQHYFLEMNTRIQVEHPITEEITGIDIVKEQIFIAMNKPLSFVQQDVVINGHAIEARIYAEDPNHNYRPSFGQILHTHIPNHPYIRIDEGPQANENLNPEFDPLLKKVIASGNNRAQTIERLVYFLTDYALFGVTTNQTLLLQILKDDDFSSGRYSTTFLDTKLKKLLTLKKLSSDDVELLAIAFTILKKKYHIGTSDMWSRLGYYRQFQQHNIQIADTSIATEVLNDNSNEMFILINGEKQVKITAISNEQNHLSFIINDRHTKFNCFLNKYGLCYVQLNGCIHIISDKPKRKTIANKGNNEDNITSLIAPMPGRIVDIMVKEGDKIGKNQTLMVLEAMKTESRMNAWKDTVVKKINVTKGQQVTLNQILIETE
jgi:acetyl/propionyl-CoA carboxylase alpha subunit